MADLEGRAAELRGVMDELTVLMREAFDTAFAKVNAAFGEYFGRLFAGGHAELVLSRPDDVLESGVDIVARPPGKRLQPLVSLSGGERALTMVALIFALLKTNPAPFCVLDEVDAALDESNVRRFTAVLRGAERPHPVCGRLTQPGDDGVGPGALRHLDGHGRGEHGRVAQASDRGRGYSRFAQRTCRPDVA